MRTQLPPHFTPKEHRLDELSYSIFDKLHLFLDEIKNIKNPMACDKKYLDILAENRTVDFYDTKFEENEKRLLIKDFMSVKRKNGTKTILLRALSFIGLHSEEYPVEIIEYYDADNYIYKPRYDGSTFAYDGTVAHNGGENMLSFVLSAWNEFGIKLSQPIGRLQEVLAVKAIAAYKPVRSRLVGFMFDLALPHDGMSFKYDSQTKYI